MKRLLLTLIMGLVSTNVLAEWTEVGNKFGDTFYTDLSSISKNGQMVKMWVLTNYSERQTENGRTYISSKDRYEFNCQVKQARILFSTLYGSPMGNGEVVYMGKRPPELIQMIKRSDTEILFNYACGKK